MGPVLGPHPHTNPTRDTRVAEPRLPAPQDGWPGEGQPLTPDAPHNGGRHTPRDGPPPPPRHAAPTGHASQGDSAGPPHPHTRAQSTWVADPGSPPRGQAAGGGGAPDLRRPSHGERHPPPGTPFRHPHSAQRRPARVHAVRPVLGPHARTNRTQDTRVAVPWLPAPEDGHVWEGQPLTPDAPHNGGRHTPRDGPPPPPRHAAPTGHASQGDSAGPPHPHTCAHSTWVADPDSPPRGRAAGEGGAPDLKRPSQRRKAPPPGDALPPPPQRATPARKGARCGAGAGSPTPTPTAPGTHGSRNPGCPPQRTGNGGAPDLRRPSQRRKAPPPGTLFHHPHSAQRRPARAHPLGPVLGPHARTNRTQDTRVAVPWLPAPEDGHLGEGQRLTPDAPHNGGRPPPPGTAPRHPRGTQPPQGMQAKGTVLGPLTRTPAPTAHGYRTPTARPEGGQPGEGELLTSDAPHNGARHPPRGHPSATATVRNPGRKGTRCGAGAESPRPHQLHPGHTGQRTPAARPRGRAAGGGTAPDTRRPSQRWQANPPGDGPPPPPRHAAPTGRASQGDSAGPPHPHTRAHSTWVTDPDSLHGGRAVGGGGAPDLRRPSQRQTAPPRGRPSATPTARINGPQGHTLWGRCWVPTPT